MKTTKRLLGLLLALVMVLGMLPLNVFAAEVAVTTTGKTGQLTNIGGSGELVGIPEGVTPTYLSDIYNTDAKVYNYVVPGSDGAVRDFALDQNFFGTRVYPFVKNADSGRYAVTKGASNLDADGYRTLTNGVKVHYSDIVLGRNTTIFEKGLSFQPSAKGAADQATVIFDISELNADYFYAVAGMTGEGNKQSYGRKMDFNVYGSKATEYSEDMEFEKLAWTTGIYCWVIGEFNVPVTGYNYLKLEAVTTVSNSAAECVWADAAVYSVHDWKAETTANATCTEDGVITYTCANEDCGETYTEVIPATGHNNGEGVVTAPTCTEAGYTTYICSVCGESNTADEVAATGHSFTNYVKDEGAYTETAKCDNCDATDTRFITFESVDVEAVADSITYLSDVYNTDAKVDSFVDGADAWKLDENWNNHTYVYTSETSRAEVKEGNANVNADGYRTVNGVDIHTSDIVMGWPAVVYEKGLGVHPSNADVDDAYVIYNVTDLDADYFYSIVGITGEGNNPRYGKEGDAQFADASYKREVNFQLLGSVDGSEFEELYCVNGISYSNTGVFNVDISGYNYIKLVTTSTGGSNEGTGSAWANACVYSLGEGQCEHSWNEGEVTTAATCSAAGVMTYTCGTCSATKTVSIMAAAHNYEAVVTEPTCTEDGFTTNTCSVCGDSYVSDEVKAAGHSFTNYVVSGYYEIAQCDNGCGATDAIAIPFEDVNIEDIADSITFLSDIYNTDAKIDVFMDPEQGTDWALDENHDTHLYVYTAEGKRFVVPAPGSTEDTRTLENGVTYNRKDIALGVGGTIYEKGLSVRPSDIALDQQAFVTYDISGLNADRFYAVVGMVGEGNNPKYTDRAVDFELWAKVNAEDEFVKLYSVDGIRISNTGVFNVDITGYNYIKLVAATAGTDDSGTTVAWGNACVYSLDSESDCEHSWNEGEVTTEATCITAGVMTYTCENCSATKTVSIMPKAEHSYDDGVVTTKPSCTDEGVMTYTCSGCGNSYTEAIEPVAHTVAHVEAVAPACEAEGNIEYWYCTECGAAWLDAEQTKVTNLKSVILPVTHTVEHVEAKAATCTELGNIEYWYCTNCQMAWTNEGQTELTNLKNVILPMADHNFVDGKCEACGEADPNYNPIVKFDFAGSTMTLGNELVLNFVFKNADLSGTDNYAKVTIAREGGDYTYEIPQSEWTEFNAAMTQIPVKVFAKEMNDEVTVIICNAAGQEVSNSRTNSVVAYCGNIFTNGSAENKIMAVDMLNYGAAAQIQFSYREGTLANAGLTEEQKALATVVTDIVDKSDKGGICAGGTLTLEDKILLNFVYQNTVINKAAYATVSYVDHYGKTVSYDIQAKDFLKFNDSMKMVQINTLVVADCRQLVSVELFDANGASMGVSVDSVESYTARSGKDLFKAILAFGDSAYNKFH